MSKAILVIDMPENCFKCKLQDWATCRFTKKCHTGNNRPDNCPLNPMPEKKVVKQYQGNGVYGFKTAEEAHFAMGWNACVEEILKEGVE